MPIVREFKGYVFRSCEVLKDVEMSEVETIGEGAFFFCHRLRRIGVP